MSVQAITCALAYRGVSSSEKLLLLALANYADETMRCWPSQTRLASDTCLSERTVRTLLSGLEARRIISRKEQRRRDGSRASDLITLHFAGPVQQPATTSGGGATIAGGVGQPLPGGGAMASGLTTFEPSVEPPEEPISVGKADPAPVRQAFDEWNALAVRLRLPAAKDLTDTRAKQIRARLARGGIATWREALAAVEASPLCRGENERGWRADLDFVCQPKSFNRLIEGFYGPKPNGQGPPQGVVNADLLAAQQARQLAILESLPDV